VNSLRENLWPVALTVLEILALRVRTQTHIERKHYLDSFHSIGYRVKGTDIYIPTLTGKPEQQQFIMQSGILTSISNRRCGEINGRPLPE